MEVVRVGEMELRFLHTKESTNGSLDLFEFDVPPTNAMPIPHYHDGWDETVYGLAGTLTIVRDGDEIDVGPAGSVFIPRGVVHNFFNRTDSVARVVSALTPGVLGPGYFRELGALVAQGAPDPAAMREVMLRHGLVPVPGR